MKIEDQDQSLEALVPELVNFFENLGDQIWRQINQLLTYPRNLLNDTKTFSPFIGIDTVGLTLRDNVSNLMNHYMELYHQITKAVQSSQNNALDQAYTIRELQKALKEQEQSVTGEKHNKTLAENHLRELTKLLD